MWNYRRNAWTSGAAFAANWYQGKSEPIGLPLSFFEERINYVYDMAMDLFDLIDLVIQGSAGELQLYDSQPALPTVVEQGGAISYLMMALQFSAYTTC